MAKEGMHEAGHDCEGGRAIFADGQYFLALPIDRGRPEPLVPRLNDLNVAG